MNPFPKDLDFAPLVGLEVIQISIGQNEVIIRFNPVCSILLGGNWKLKDKQGVVIDRSMEHSERDSWRIHKLLGRKIDDCVVVDERHLDILFDGFDLEVEDDDDHYETFSIEHPLLKLYI
jgi:hypothetical protein